MRSEAAIAETNKKLDEVLAHGEKFALGWLRGAFHTHEAQKESLLSDLWELRALFLAAVQRPLTVREAQLLKVCRVCRGQVSGKFLLNFGEEFAHEECVTPRNPCRKCGGFGTVGLSQCDRCNGMGTEPKT